MTATWPTEAACAGWYAAIRAQHRPGATPDLAELARAGITPLVGGRNNAVYRCDDGVRSCCIKLYRVDDRRRDEREWRALTFLATHLPGLAPQPFRHSPDQLLPLVAMEYLPGESLLGLPLAARHLDALFEGLRRIYTITPATADYPDHSTGTATTLLARVESWAPSATPPTRAALDRWLTGDDPGVLRRPGAPVFGVADPNLANWLWSGGALRRVDLEYAGWSDLASELADLTEGPWARGITDAAWLTFAARFPDLDRERFLAARRLIAHFWLALFDSRGNSRAPQQLARVRTLMEAA